MSTVKQLRLWLARRICPPGWGLCMTGRFPKSAGRDTHDLTVDYAAPAPAGYEVEQEAV